jgi:hypothetical protein
MYKAVVIFIALLILCGYIYFSKPDKVVLNEKGNVEGLVNKARALLQGDKFWKYQLILANELFIKNNTPQLPSSAEMQALYRKVREDQRLLDEKMKVLYTTEEETAKMLRMKADSIELVGKWRSIDDAAEAARMQEVQKFKIIIPIIENKLHISKPQSAPVPN